MAAENYRICCAIWNAYIAKVSKRNPNMMLEDRRIISDGEILTLIDWFLDNCIGSGTTAVAAIKEKRHFIGMELDKDYFNIACKRVNDELGTLALF